VFNVPGLPLLKNLLSLRKQIKTMIQVYPNLYVGSQDDYERSRAEFTAWLVIHACKEPYHRQALGYTGRAASKDHPEDLIAKRDNRLILNLVDAADPAYIPDQIMDTAIGEIHAALPRGQKVFVHCNQGHSRSPAIAMLYLGTHTDVLPVSFEEAFAKFNGIYPPFAPAGGTLGFLRRRWSQFS
jgi:predicted protein tyrosine phosphatase